MYWGLQKSERAAWGRTLLGGLATVAGVWVEWPPGMTWLGVLITSAVAPQAWANLLLGALALGTALWYQLSAKYIVITVVVSCLVTYGSYSKSRSRYQ
jgi:hypothetical protein